MKISHFPLRLTLPLQLLISIAALSSINPVFSQAITMSVQTSNGGQYTLSDCTVDWSLGEWMVESLSEGITLEQGFLHSLEMQQMTTGALSHQLLNVEIWPNPTSDFIHIRIPEVLQGSIRLINDLGHSMRIWPLEDLEKTIDIRQIASGHYYLVIESKRQIVHLTPILIIH